MLITVSYTINDDVHELTVISRADIGSNKCYNVPGTVSFLTEQFVKRDVKCPVASSIAERM